MILDALSLHILAQAAEGGASSTMIVVIIVAAVVLGLILFLVTRGGKAPETPKATPPKEGEDEKKPSTNLLEDRMEVDAPVEIHDGMSLAEIKRAKAARVRKKGDSKRETAVEATERSKADHGVEDKAESAEEVELEEPAEVEESSDAVAAEVESEDVSADEPTEGDESNEAADVDEPEEAEEAAESKEAPKKLPKPSLPNIGGLPAPSEVSEVSEDDDSKPSKLPRPKLGKLPRPKTKLPESSEVEDEAVAKAPVEESDEPAEEAPEAAEAVEAADAVEAVETTEEPAETEEEPELEAAPEVDDAVEAETAEAAEEKATSLEEGLAKTRTGFIQRLSGLFQKETLDDDIVEEVEEVLFTADIGPSAAQKIMNALEEELEKEEKNDPSAVWRFVRNYVEELLASHEESLEVGAHQPFVMLVIGVNGVGKTTTIGKMASKYKRQGKSVLMVAGDTFRAAAVEQLEVWGERTGIEVYKGKEEQDPASVVYEGVEKAVKDEIDVVICDTAGRLQTNVNLLDELAKMSRVAGKVVEGSPHETILVLDANTGQNAIQQAKLFNEAVDISGIVLTKLDGTAKGGVILGICDEIAAPIRYIGIGEGVADLREFDSGEFVEALFM